MMAFNACCFESVAGNPDASLDFLERAIQLGFRNTNWLHHDPDLDNVRKLPRFIALVHRTETA